MGQKLSADAQQDLVMLEKCPTGIRGLDEVTRGGLPRNRPALICGGPGCGKTLLAMEFLVRGAMEFDEPGIFVAFEETPDELAKNVASLGFHLKDLEAREKLGIDHIRIERSEIEVTGEYDLEGLFIRIGYMVDTLGARRIVLDTLESLFSALPNEAILRAELRRLFRWLKERKLTAIITAERGEKSLTRHGLEEYVSDAVILLDHRVIQEVATRRMRVVKYRGSSHGTNEYPFLIDDRGFSVLPITEMGLDYEVASGRVPTGVPQLDERMDGGGYMEGSSVLITGSAGTGKSTLSASFAHGLCEQGKRCVYFAFEESPRQIVRNMRSVGIDLQQWVDAGLLRFRASRPTVNGLEMHLLAMHNEIDDFEPAGIIVDPISNLITSAEVHTVRAMLMRVIDFLKMRQITSVFTSLTPEDAPESTEAGVSSLMDTWLVVRNQNGAGERNRLLQIYKSRGMAHSNQMAEFQITSQGLQLLPPYVGPGQVLTGSARLAQENRDRAEAVNRQRAVEARQRDLERCRRETELQIESMRAAFEAQERELQQLIEEERQQQDMIEEDRRTMSRLREP